MPRHPDTGRVRRYCIYYNLSGIISQQLSQECKKIFQIPGGLRQKMGDWREKMGVFPSPPPHQRDWNNIKVSPAFSKAAGARGQAPVKKREAPQRGEQTGRAIHPVDGSRDRLCDPVRQSTRDIHPAQKGSGLQKASLNRSPPPQTIGQPAAAIEPLRLSEIQKPEDVVYCELRLGLA